MGKKSEARVLGMWEGPQRVTVMSGHQVGDELRKGRRGEREVGWGLIAKV